MIKKFFILLLAIVASVGMSFAQDPGIVSSGTKGGMSYTFYDNGLLEISGSGALPGHAFTNWDGGFGTSVKNIRFAEDCEVYGLDYLWFACYTENSQLETVEINSVAPILFSGTSGAGIFYRQDGAVTITITAPGIVDAENRIIDNYGSPVNMIFNMPATTVFERKWFSGLENYFAVTIPTGAKGHIPAGYVFKDSYDQMDYDQLVADGYEEIFWDTHSYLEEGVDYTLGEESTFVITAENASQIFGQATVSFQAPTEASNSEWVLWRKSDLKEFPDMSSGNQKVCKDVTVKVNNGVYDTNSGFGLHFESLGEDGVQFVAPEGKVFKRIVILNEYGTFSDPNWSYDSNYKRWSGSADTVGFVGNICGISLIEFEVEASAPANSCGDGLTWELNNGELVISYDGEGTGVMNDYDIPNDNPAPWYANREDITSVSLPEGIKTIGKDAFRDCVNLTTVTIPNSVTTIGESAFVTVEHLETVTIGTGITSIVNGAFYGCEELTTVTCSATTPPSIGEMVFGSCTKLTQIVVPTESVDAYKTAWSAYASLISSATPAGPIPCTLADLGKVLCTDGSIYATVSEAAAASKTAAAVIAYVDTENGKALALALANESGTMDWETAKTTAAAHTPAVSGGTWTLASKDDWDHMVNAAGGYNALRDGFSGVGGTNIQKGQYWTSTEYSSGVAMVLNFGTNDGGYVVSMYEDPCNVRACLAFDIPAAPAYETVMNLINAIGTVELTAECKAKIDAARAAYDALSDGDKAQVTNIATLTTAEAAFDNVMDIWLSGDCDVILWSDTTLTVRKHAGEGNGAMADYNYMSRAPWYNNHWYDPKPNDIVIKSVTIEEGVTHLGDYAFAWMSEMKTITIPSSVTTIPEDAFYWSKAVDDIYLTADTANLTWALPYSADNQFKPSKATRCHVPSDLLEAYQTKFPEINVTFVGDLAPVDPAAGAAAIVDLINAIGTVEYTDECKAKIDAAREAYDKAVDAVKDLISADDLKKLTDAETDYAALKLAADQAAADPVIALINQLPNPVEEKDLKLSVYDKVLDARAAYDALNAAQQALVTNYQTLLDAEAAFDAIGGGGGLPTGALTGAFSVGTSSAICFSQGNLQATTADLGANWTWSFAEHQWDFIGNAVANTAISDNKSVSTNGTVDLFGWSTAATYYGINNNPGAAYYTGDFIDWGTNAISNGGNTANAWHTLAHDEWDYLFNTRTTTSGIRYAKATVNGIPGIILLPDDWSATYYALSNTNDYEVDYNSNVITTSDWTNSLEANGAVFLPAAGERLGADVNEVGSNGHYWSSTFKTDYNAYCLSFKSYNVDASDYINRREGYSVRLVVAAPVNYIAEAQAAVDLINAIPDPVTLDEACVKAIKDAREAVTALGEKASLIDAADMAKLTNAEAALTALNQAEADKVIAKINEIPSPMTEADLKLSIYDKVTGAREAYDALTAEQKALIEAATLKRLTDAEDAFAAIGGGGGPAFSVNASGDVVVFAPGNLQATLASSTWTWSFAANQWDIIGNAAGNTSVNGNGTLSADGTVDLFGWVGNSSTVLTDGMAQNGISNSQTAADYGNVAVEALKSDWSTFANANSLGGRTDWRLLTNDEWAYIINTRSATYRYCKAKVNNVIGLVIFPDGYTHPSGVAAIQEANDPKGAYNSNVWTAEDWALMATAGATFLPAGGNRVGEKVYNVDNFGRYWSSSSHPQSAASAYGIEFSYTGSQYDNVRLFGLPRYYGASIRLAAPAVVSPIAQAQAAVALINAIPNPVTLDEDCVKAIKDARAAVDALGENAKLIDAADMAKLTDAEQALKDLNQAEADKVIAKINAIPLPVELKLATRDSIESARAAYDALTADQKLLVTNYQTLLDAEAALAALNPGVPPATPLDSAQAVKDLIDAIPTPVEYPTSGPAIAAALVAYNQLSDAAKGALDDADVQKMTDAATQYAALDAIAAIEAIPAEIVYDPAVKAAIETAREKYDALIDASKALVDDEVVAKLTNAEEAWAILVAKIEHNVSYIGKDGELKNEIVALLHIPDPAPDFNGYEFVRWDVKAGDFLEEGLRIKAVYAPIITTNPQGFDTLAYNGLAQELVKAGVAKEGHIEYSLYPEEPESWSAELPKATNAGVYAIYYKLVREGHADYIASEPTMATIAKVPVTYVAPTAVESLVYTAANQTLIAAGQTQDGTFEYSLDPTLLDSWKAELPQAKDAGTYSVYYRVQGDLNHLDSVAATPVAVAIAKAELTATADDKNVIYGDAVPAYTVTYAGWLGEDGASVLTGTIAFACDYVKGSPVGEYVITPSGVDAADYAITFVNGKVTVDRKSAKSDDITAKQADNEMLVYDAEANKPTIIVKDTTLVLTENTDYKLTFIGRGNTEYAESATAPAHVGEYTAIVAFIGNYKDTLTVDFVINKAPLTITAEDKAITFGEYAPEFTVAYEGFLGTDTATVLTGVQAYACEYVRGNNVGDYTIIPSGVDAHDYAITFVNGTLTVNRKSAKDADIAAKQADNEVLVYDAEVNRPTIIVKDTTLVLTEAQDYVLTFKGVAADQSIYAESETAPTHVGNYTAIVAFIGNYIDTLTVDFTINKAPLTITANDTAMIYGDVAPEFTVSYAGWFGNDDKSVLLGTQAYDCVYAPGSPIGTYVITPKGVDAYDYAITFVDGTLTVNKAHVYVSGAEVHTAKFADGHTTAEVTGQGTLNGIKLNDPIAHVTTASFSSADVAEHLTITLFYELTGSASLLNNYYLEPTQEVFTTEGVIIEPFIPDNEDEPEDKEATVNEGIEIYAYGYCDGSGYSLKYHLESGNPDQYKIDFADSRFTDVDWTNLEITGKDGTIDIEIPVDLPTGDYTMTVYFRDSRFDWLESRQFNVTFHVNLPETYIRPLFENVIALVDTCHCLTDIQWYWRANSNDTWVAIPGANGYYYHSDTKLAGEYFVSAKMNGEPTYTCGQADMETLYGDDTPKAQVKAYPNPVIDRVNVTIEGSEAWTHTLRVVSLMGSEVINTNFDGNETTIEMIGVPQGNYMISVDGIVVKVMKK